MTDTKELRRLAEAVEARRLAINQEWTGIYKSLLADSFAATASPSVVLALLDEVERYREIRLGKVYIEPGAGEIYVAGDKRGHYCKTEGEFDAAIDAAVGKAASPHPEKEAGNG